MSEIVLSSLALSSAAAIWWTWRRRFEAEQRAELALREASANRELADAGRAAEELAHDLGNLVAVLHLNLHDLDWSQRERAREAVRDLQTAALAVYTMFSAWRGESERASIGSSAFLLTTLCSLIGRTGIDIEPRVEAALPFDGSDDDVVRVFEHLLVTASREAIRAGDPRVDVEMSAGALRIEHRIADPHALEERMREVARGRQGWTARSLTIARAAAARVGWRIVHALGEERMTVLVQPIPPEA